MSGIRLKWLMGSFQTVQTHMFVSRIDRLLGMESNRLVMEQEIYLNDKGKIESPQLQVSEGALA